MEKGFPAYIFAGGRSSRFGSDKARAEVLGQLQLPRLIRLLEAQGHSVSVVADARDRYRDLGLDCLVDQQPGSGPVTALLTAARHREAQLGSGWFLCLGCDQLRWLVTWTRALVNESKRAAHAAPCELVTFSGLASVEEDRFQPLPALFHTALATTIKNAICNGKGASLMAVLRETPKSSVFVDESPRGWSFNTPDELHRLTQRMEAL